MLALANAVLLSAAALPGAIQKLPVTDRQDIRFVRLRDGSETFRTWVGAIAQDHYGFLWLGTDDGLYRYDGYRLKSYRHDPANPRSLSENTIKVLYKDRSGIVWVGTGYGGLDRLDPAQDTFTHYRRDPADGRSLSDDTVGAILEDRAGRLWVGTNGGLDRLDAASGRFVHYQYPAEDHGRSNPITVLYEDRHGTLLAGTISGLYRVEEATGRMVHFPDGSSGLDSPANQFISGLLEDRGGVLWVTTLMGNGLNSLDTKTGVFTRYSFHSEPPESQRVAGVNAIHEDRDGVLWLGTFRDGLLQFDPTRKGLVRYSTEPNHLFPDFVGAVFEDAEGGIWVSGHGGVSRFPLVPEPFVNYQHDPRNPNSLHDDKILSVHADAHGFLWIGTEGGLHRLDRQTGRVVFYQHDPRDRNSISYNEVSAIIEDGSGGLWIGTHGGGLNHFDRGTSRFSAYRNNPADPQSLSSDLVQSLLLDRKGVLWVGTHTGGLNRFDPATGRSRSYRHDPSDSRSVSEDNIREIFEDRNGVLWIGTNHGLDRFDPVSERFTVFLHDIRNAGSLSHNSIGSIFEDSRGDLWIGTRSGLDRFDRARGIFESFTTKDGLADDAIEAIREDSQGNLWLATHAGLSRFHPRTKAVTNYTESDGLPGDYVNPSGKDRSCVTPDGELVFGSEYGVTVFDPNRLSENKYVPPVVLTDFLLFSKPVSPDRGAPLQQPIWAAHSVVLNHRQDIFTFVFSALSYAAPERNRYRYRLEGLERDWNEVDSGRRVATYTNLPPRKYVFRVQGSNDHQIWNETGARLDVTVLPPWWGTWWFRSLACVTGVCLIYASYRARVRGLHAAASRLEMQVAQRTRELQIAKDAADAANRAKSTFLANMSHELRTPLNAILGFSNLLRKSAASEKQRQDLDIINRSGEHLLGLINDVLDVAKVEAGRVEFRIAPYDLKRRVDEVADMMCGRAREKGLTLNVSVAPEVPRFVKTDEAKLSQVLINLVGNAVQFTEKGGVTLRAGARPALDGRRVLLKFEVEDTGIGIAPEDRRRIFEPFVQVGNFRAQKGSGLGLAITRQFVELMGGTIQVESTQGYGSIFRVELPVEAAEESEVLPAETDGDEIAGLETGQPECRILIVEDEEANWLLLQRLLEDAGFQVRVATDGIQGIEAFAGWRPHFIWMDLRMPQMDGWECTRRIRALEGGRDVKIAAATASTFESERERVLGAGFDDFIRKPYHSRVIFECLDRQLKLRWVYRKPHLEERAMVLAKEDLRTLPEEVLRELAAAVGTLDTARIREAIARISVLDAGLGKTLTQYADRFAYTAILNAAEAGLEGPGHSAAARPVEN